LCVWLGSIENSVKSGFERRSDDDFIRMINRIISYFQRLGHCRIHS
jgi:hypothetical protein